ncbi:hypothetical protein AAFF_G00267710 [Aldrovandia affinis]|uniref:Uncharacterized protein n=1 Tax=Aldrovandia affinis TaxID=143900 RepID=A0AAD7WSL1_9TELE|nr:hypothetical protein AAFF_G00267710 [Aldrovandia affinis]
MTVPAQWTVRAESAELGPLGRSRGIPRTPEKRAFFSPDSPLLIYQSLPTSRPPRLHGDATYSEVEGLPPERSRLRCSKQLALCVSGSTRPGLDRANNLHDNGCTKRDTSLPGERA